MRPIKRNIQICGVIMAFALLTIALSSCPVETKCGYCGGSGVCKMCNGIGETTNILCDTCNGTGKYYITCPVCGGKGKVPTGKCSNCRGTGKNGARACIWCEGSGRCSWCNGKGCSFCYNENCYRCHGSGRYAITCPTCEGNGFVNGRTGDDLRICFLCKGSGICKYCNGKGYKE